MNEEAYFAALPSGISDPAFRRGEFCHSLDVTDEDSEKMVEFKVGVFGN
jgi:hypothetical protein